MVLKRREIIPVEELTSRVSRVLKEAIQPCLGLTAKPIFEIKFEVLFEDPLKFKWKVPDLENHGKARQLSIKKSPTQCSMELCHGQSYLKKKVKKKNKKKTHVYMHSIFFERTFIHLEISAKIESKLLEPWLEQELWPIDQRRAESKVQQERRLTPIPVCRSCS